MRAAADQKCYDAEGNTQALSKYESLTNEQIKGPPTFTHTVPSAPHAFHPSYLPNIYLSSLEAFPDPSNLGEVLVLGVPITPMLYNVC